MSALFLPETSLASYRVWRIELPDGPEKGLVSEAVHQYGPRTRWLVAWIKYLNEGWPTAVKGHGVTELWSLKEPYPATDITQETLLDPLIAGPWATFAPGWLWQTIKRDPSLMLSPAVFKAWSQSPDRDWRLRAIQLFPRLSHASNA